MRMVARHRDDGMTDSPHDALQFVVALSGRRFVLFLLIASLDAAGEAPTGATLREAYNAVADEELSDGGFYPALDAMVDAGVIERVPAGGRETHWRVSDRGWQQLDAGYQWVGRIIDDAQTLETGANSDGENT